MTTESKPAGRVPVVDLVKVLASQLIVWHHLVCYGPIGRSAHSAFDHLSGWLAVDGRAAVYAFLVIGGYLAAGTVLPRPGRPMAIAGAAGFLRLAVARYRRLAPPYFVAIAAAVAVALFARVVMTDADTPAAPGIGQLVAHALMLQELLDYPALSAGVWYVAIDLQLFLLLAAVAWVAQAGGRRGRLRASGGRAALADGGADPRAGVIATVLVLVLALASWGFWNRVEGFDDYAIYFFGAYGLGVIARWSREVQVPYHGDRRERERLHPARCEWIAVVMAVGGVALLWDPDRREWVAAGVALLLALAPRQGPGWLAAPAIAALSRRSYSLFLIHYPVCLLANALFALATGGAWTPPAAAGVVALVVAWIASNLASEVVYRWVESPEGRRRLVARLLRIPDERPGARLASK